MSKVLYIGHYKDGTGWGDAAINNILALDSAGVKVVPRAISYNKQDSETHPRILELEKQSTDGCDICIQHTLPVNYVYDSNMKNIGFLATESSDFCDTGWHKNINILDELWVPSEYSKECCKKSGVTIPVSVAPHSLNIEEYKNPVNGAKVVEMLKSFNFVFVGEFIERKNLKALVKAFHTEFHPSENVNLFIKTSGVPLGTVQQYCTSIKNGLKLRKKYKEELVVCDKLKKEDYISLLQQCHCLIMPSRGEAFCIPALEVMSAGIPVIYTSGIAMEEFCVGNAVNSYNTPCFGGVDSLSNLYTANSDWKEIDIRDLQIKMRNIFMQKDNMKELSKKCKEQANMYSHKNVGQILKGLIYDQ